MYTSLGTHTREYVYMHASVTAYMCFCFWAVGEGETEMLQDIVKTS